MTKTGPAITRRLVSNMDKKERKIKELEFRLQRFLEQNAELQRRNRELELAMREVHRIGRENAR